MVKHTHTADWQLGKPIGQFPDEVAGALSGARRDVIETIGDVASSNGARHILVAGDVFDNVERGDRVMVQAMARMRNYLATWWLMPGNCDPARSDGLWSRVWQDTPANVKVLD